MRLFHRVSCLTHFKLTRLEVRVDIGKGRRGPKDAFEEAAAESPPVDISDTLRRRVAAQFAARGAFNIRSGPANRREDCGAG